MAKYEILDIVDSGGAKGFVAMTKDGMTYRVIIDNERVMAERAEVKVAASGNLPVHWRALPFTPRSRNMMAIAIKAYREKWCRRDLHIELIRITYMFQFELGCVEDLLPEIGLGSIRSCARPPPLPHTHHHT